jgi:hypothetical protein
LECGNAPAVNIYLRTIVECVSSNQIFFLFKYNPAISAPEELRTKNPALVGKTVLLPGEHAKADEIYFPDMGWLNEFYARFGDDVLVRVYVIYERSGPAYHRNSGYFNFLFNTPNRLLTEEERPSIHKILERYNSIPRSERFALYWNPGRPMNEWMLMKQGKFGEWPDMPDVDFGGFSRSSGSNIFVLQESWAKHH